MSEKRVKSILNELDSILPERNKHNVIDARASHVITSAINLIESIKENYTEEQAIDLEKRLMLSIRNRDQTKFSKKINQIRNKNE